MRERVMRERVMWERVMRALCFSVFLYCLTSLQLMADEHSKRSPPLFERSVRPILRKCIGCHGPDRPKADLCLTDRSSAIEIGAIVPHDADMSSLVERITSSDTEFRMPPDEPLSQSEVNILRHWIEAGAVWPEHWSYRMLSRPSLPELEATMPLSGCANPIDRFIAAELGRANLTPSPPTDRRTLLRRVSYDLVGMPPTPEEIARFEMDQRPDAYQRVVDRLLASPRYGERWARHWMDVVHFAETHGHDQDRPREHAWPYRDYLIRRLNEDASYGRFVREQIAGDVIFPHDAWSIVATGFLAAGPWDESSLRDIQEGSIDREKGRYLDRDDMVTTVMSTFASTSVHCARCHHHKFDPITQDEYYGLQAVFSGIDKANRKYEPASIAQRRQQLQQELSTIKAWRDAESPELLKDKLQFAAAEWENLQQGKPSPWSSVELLELRSRAGQTLTRQDDNTIFVQGDRPERDSYTVLATTKLSHVRAIRLAVLADQRLPMNGPGRQDNGNFHLSELRLFAVDANDPRQQRRIAIRQASSDFDQSDWSVSKAIDGDPKTAWGVYPEVGNSHYAVFEFEPTAAESVDARRAVTESAAEESVLLRIELDQMHGAGHLIGSFEVAVTNEDGPLPTKPEFSSDILSILKTDAAARSDDQRRQLAAYVEQHRIQDELATLPEPAMVYCGTNQFDADGSFRPTKSPRDVYVLDRGEIDKPLRVATATTLSCIKHVEADADGFGADSEARRRIALAEWLASPKNGLVWRSIANRVWHYHFGKPLVDTPNDFGVAGSCATHPQLLDWLAATLQENDGSLKALHRLIVTSATYQQSSGHRVLPARLDVGNRLLWRMNRTRLDAESFRDSLLQISGSLDNRMGGPSDRQFNQSQGVHVTPVVDYQGFDINHRSNFRRSVYRFIFRTVPDPFMAALDCPDAAQLSPKRSVSVTAVQTLATMNDKFVVRQCELMASRIADACSSTDEQVEAAFLSIHGRRPTPSESVAVTQYVDQHGLTNACRLLVNTNEFMFVD